MNEMTFGIILGFIGGVSSCALLVFGIGVWEDWREGKHAPSKS